MLNAVAPASPAATPAVRHHGGRIRTTEAAVGIRRFTEINAPRYAAADAEADERRWYARDDEGYDARSGRI